MHRPPADKHFSEKTGKLHIPCPHKEKTGIMVHVVIREGFCYRSKECMVVNCRYNALQSDIPTLISIVW